jgi:peptide deformylase
MGLSVTGLICIAVVCSVFARDIAVPTALDEAMFVETTATADELIADVLPRLIVFLENHPTLCGAAAPNVGSNFQMVLLRSGDYMFNPNVVSVNHERNRNVSIIESSYMCHDRTYQRQVLRMTSIMVAFTDRDTTARVVPLESEDAICVQHFIDIFLGHWPCKHEGVDALKVPRLFHSLQQDAIPRMREGLA